MSDHPQVLVLGVPEGIRVGGNVKLLVAAVDREQAEKKLADLGASVTGRVAVVEVHQVYDRRPTIENVAVDAPVVDVG